MRKFENKNHYLPAAIALSRYDFSAQELAVILGCGEDRAAKLRSLYKICDGSWVEMQTKNNEASTSSRERSRAIQRIAA